MVQHLLHIRQVLLKGGLHAYHPHNNLYNSSGPLMISLVHRLSRLTA